jgi:hypothetical protein
MLIWRTVFQDSRSLLTPACSPSCMCI